MSNYTKTTDFQAKDSLPTGNANKVVKGAEIDTEFNAIATAIATKANTASPTFTGTMTAATATFSGNVTIGDAATDTVTVNSDVASNLIPSADSTYALGDSSNYWSNAYVDAVTTTGNVSVGGNLTVTGNATISGTLTFGDADTDSITLNAEIASDVIPDVDGTYDLGSAAKEWQDLYIDGTANIDSLVADTADINSGTIDNTVIGGTTAVAGTFTTATATTGAITTVNSTTVNATTVDSTNVEVTNIKAKDGTASASIADSTGVMTVASAVLTTADINGGSIDNATIGATTASTGNFSTLSIGGTAITATAAELNTLDGITATVTELNYTDGVTSNIQTQLDAKQASDADLTAIAALANTDGNFIVGNGTTWVTESGDTAIFSLGITATAAELNTLDGITATVTELNYTDGVTSNIQTQLDAKAPINAATFTGTTTIPTADINGGTIDGVTIGGSTAAAGTFTTFTSTGIDDNASSTAITIDSSGNVLFGATGSAGSIGLKRSSDGGAAGALSISGDDLIMNTGYASGNLIFKTVTSERMRISSTGSVGIGTTSPDTSTKFEVNSGTLNNVAHFVSTDPGAYISFSDSTTTDISYVYVGAAGDALALAAGGSSRMTIDSSGNVGIGVTPSTWNSSFKAIQGPYGGGLSFYNSGGFPATYLTANAYYDQTASDWIAVQTDQAGLYAIEGTTGKHLWYTKSSNTTAGSVIGFTNSMTLDSSGSLTLAGGNTVFNGGGYFRHVGTYARTTATAANLYIYTDGQFYRSTSSKKYKENITDYDKGLSEVLALRPVYYTGTGEADGDKQYAGLIAEEVHDAGLTEFVQYAEDDTPDALSYGHMVSLLTKAIQEQQAIIDDLKARIETLEGE